MHSDVPFDNFSPVVAERGIILHTSQSLGGRGFRPRFLGRESLGVSRGAAGFTDVGRVVALSVRLLKRRDPEPTSPAVALMAADSLPNENSTLMSSTLMPWCLVLFREGLGETEISEPVETGVFSCRTSEPLCPVRDDDGWEKNVAREGCSMLFEIWDSGVRRVVVVSGDRLINFGDADGWSDGWSDEDLNRPEGSRVRLTCDGSFEVVCKNVRRRKVGPNDSEASLDSVFWEL